MTDRNVSALGLIPVLREYPVRPDNTVNLTPGALRRLGWSVGTMIQVWVDENHDQIILTRAKRCEESVQ